MSEPKASDCTTSDKPLIYIWPSLYCPVDEVHVVCNQINLKAVLGMSKGAGRRVIKHEAMNQPISQVFKKVDKGNGVEV